MTIHKTFFNYRCSVGALTDIGRKRASNQDETLVCPEIGFYGVSDGMGGLSHGAETSQMICELLPEMLKKASQKLTNESGPELAAGILTRQICLLNDTILADGFDDSFDYGATLSSVWLIGGYAVFVNIGDSRGYLLSCDEKKITQITKDHNEAALLLEQKVITKKGILYKFLSNQLNRFMGMEPPAMPEVFIREVYPGDMILLCSDGLHGMVKDSFLPAIMRSAENPVHVCEKLVEKANTLGGDDNISVVLIKIE